MIKNTDKAYAAGYIDGDGCFHLGKPRKKFISSIIIVSTDKSVLDWFQSLWGGNLNAAKKVPNQKIVYRLELKKAASTHLVSDIHCFLNEKFDEASIYSHFISTDDTDKKLTYIDEIRRIKNSTNRVLREHKQEFESIRDTIQPSQDDYAYLAGFIDAECCFGIQKNKHKARVNPSYKIYLICNNTKFPVFKWLLERFGGTINFIERASKYPGHNNQMVWRISARKLGELLSKIHPYLKYKQPVCEELMKFYATVVTNGGGCRDTEAFSFPAGNTYANIMEERERIIAKVHILNLKGSK